MKQADRRGRLQDESGATAVEYALIMGLIAAVIIVTVGLLGVTTVGLFNRPCTEMNSSGVTC
jgi:pilus assembly protein Flp/PilA